MLFPDWFDAWLVIAQRSLLVLLVLAVLAYLWRRSARAVRSFAGHIFAQNLSSLRN
jgi:hypothetical protein